MLLHEFNLDNYLKELKEYTLDEFEEMSKFSIPTDNKIKNVIGKKIVNTEKTSEESLEILAELNIKNISRIQRKFGKAKTIQDLADYSLCDYIDKHKEYINEVKKEIYKGKFCL